MEPNISTIRDITTATQFPWTVKVVVLEKMPARESGQTPMKQTNAPHRPLTSPSKYQHLVVADEKGTRVQLTIFGKDITVFEDNLVIGKTYYISNCKVTYIERNLRLVPQHDYQWILGASSLIKVVNDSNQLIVPVFNNLVSFKDLHSYKDGLTTVDIVGIALHLLPIKERTTKTGLSRLQELIIINKEMQPMMLTMWNHFLDHEAISLAKAIVRKPVILARRMRVASYSGLSLSTKTQSSIVIDPDVPEANELQVWLSTNFSAVHAFTLTKTFQAFTETPGNFSIEESILFSELASLPDNRSYPAKCTMEIVDFHQQFYYMSCFRCYKSTSALYKEVFTCNHCKRADTYAVPRCCIHVNATDSSETITATLFGTDAETFVGCKALTIMQNVAKISSIINCKTDGAMRVTVKPYHHNFRGESIRRFNISLIDHDSGITQYNPSPSESLLRKRKLIFEDVEQVVTPSDLLSPTDPKNSIQEISMPLTISVADLLTLPLNENYPLQCTLEVVDFTQKFWFMSCFVCFEATTATFQQVFECKNCKRDDTYAVPRCFVRVNVKDASGIITANLFSKDAEKFLACKAQAIMENLNEKSIEDICSIIKCKSDGMVQVMIKPYKYQFQGETVRKYDISLINGNLTPVNSQTNHEVSLLSESSKGKSQEQHMIPKKNDKAFVSHASSTVVENITDTFSTTVDQSQSPSQ